MVRSPEPRPPPLCTPFPTPGAMPIDQEVYAQLRATGQFDTMSREQDEVRGRGAWGTRPWGSGKRMGNFAQVLTKCGERCRARVSICQPCACCPGQRQRPNAHAPCAMRRMPYVVQAEHSLELHTPYIVHTMAAAGRPFTLVPIMVGALTTQA